MTIEFEEQACDHVSMIIHIWFGLGIFSSCIRTFNDILESAGITAWLYFGTAPGILVQNEGTKGPTSPWWVVTYTELAAKMPLLYCLGYIVLVGCGHSAARKPRSLDGCNIAPN